MTLDDILRLIDENSAKIKDFGVRRIGVFGSYARGKQKLLSDVDLIVEFDTKTYDNYMDLKHFLEELFGLEVDIAIAESIKPRLRKTIFEGVIYAKGL